VVGKTNAWNGSAGATKEDGPSRRATGLSTRKYAASA